VPIGRVAAIAAAAGRGDGAVATAGGTFAPLDSFASLAIAKSILRRPSKAPRQG